MSGRALHLDWEHLTGEQRQLYEAITAGPRAQRPQLFDLVDEDGKLLGPFGPLLLVPHVGDRIQALGAALRFDSALTPRVREAVILVVAAHFDSAFERHAHEAVGRSVGLSEDELEGLRSPHPSSVFADPSEEVVIRLARDLLVRGDTDDDYVAKVVRDYGPETVLETTVLVGYYSMLAAIMTLFGTDKAPADPSQVTTAKESPSAGSE